MIKDDDRSGPLHPAMVLGAAAATLVRGRRVALFGDASTPLADQLAGASGRRVHVFDPEPTRVAAAIARSRGRTEPVSYAVLDPGGEVRAEAFDAVVIPDLTRLRQQRIDPGQLIATAQATLSARGFALVAAARGTEEGLLGYYQLFDLVAARFEHVRMLGQAPFVGYALADFSAGEGVPITVDGSLATAADEPCAYLALGSDHPVEVEPYLLVQLPASTALGWLGPAPGAVDVTELSEARLRQGVLETEIEKLRERERESARVAEERRQSAAALSARIAELEVEIGESRRQHRTEIERLAARRETERERQRDDFQEELDRVLERVAELEDELAAAQAPAETPPAPSSSPPAAADAPATELPARAVTAYEFQIAELQRALDRSRSSCDSLAAEAARTATLTAENEQLRRSLSRFEQARSVASDEAEPAAREIAALEERLRERGHLVARLRRELRESEAVGRELIRKLAAVGALGHDRPPATPPEATTAEAPRADLETAAAPAEAAGPQLDALVRECARYQADLQAARWRVEALALELAERPDRASDAVKLEAALRAARDEIASLRAPSDPA